MFTGLVQAVGRVAAVRETAAGMRLEIDVGAWGHVAELGESISVSGCCLTVVDTRPAAAGTGGTGGMLMFDVVRETLGKTTLGAGEGWREGRRVNLEHSVRAATLMGGHIVQGHVDGVGEVIRVVKKDGEVRVAVRPREGGLMEYITPKGSVCVDGVSLTAAGVDVAGGAFEVALIPETLARTTLGELGEGGLVNLEMDVIAKTVVHWVRHYGGRGR